MTVKGDMANAKLNRFQGDIESQYGNVIANNFVPKGANRRVVQCVEFDSSTFRTTTAAAGVDVGVVLPANAQIIDVRTIVRGGAGTATTMDIGKEGDVDFFVNNLSVGSGVNVAGTTQASEAAWTNVGDDDVPVFANIAASRSGLQAFVVIQFIV